MRRARRLLLLAVAMLGCASAPPDGDDAAAPETEPAELEAELVDVGSRLLGHILAEKARLENVGYRLNRAARRFCGDLVRPQVGALVGGAQSIDLDWQQQAVRNQGVGEVLTILHVVPGGPFDRAGFLPGDGLVSFGSASPQTRSELVRLLVASPGLARVEVVRRRDGEDVAFEVELDMACPIPFELGRGVGLLPGSSSRLGVAAPRGLVHYAQDDDVLAVPLAHQLAHILFDPGGEDDLVAELRADRMGILLAAAAGYDIGVTVRFWEDMARAYPWLITPERARVLRRDRFRRLLSRYLYDHHDIARRMEGIRARAAEVESLVAEHTASTTGP